MRYRFAIDIKLKDVILDPQGQALSRSADLLNFKNIKDIRMGKHIEIEVEHSTEEAAYEEVRAFTERLLYNPIIEHYNITPEPSY